MANWTNFYLFNMEFLGFRYSGWQKQPKVKTIHGMVDKTFDFIFDHTNFKTLGCGRTDAKVSADDYYFELFVNETLDVEDLKVQANRNMPPDIRIKDVSVVDANFNIIQDVQQKEYHYYFSGGQKAHPFSAPYMWSSLEALDIDKMKQAASLFVGKHQFGWYAVQPSAKTVLEREIYAACIELSPRFTGQFAPADVYVFKVAAKGFMRNQVRMMMGALIDVGLGVMSLENFKQTLVQSDDSVIKRIAPASGLILHKVDLSR